MNKKPFIINYELVAAKKKKLRHKTILIKIKSKKREKEQAS
jgi:hypothetical protein